jgi:hypothetical protein
MSSTRIFTCVLAVANVFFVGQAFAQSRPVTVTNTPLPVKVTNPAVPIETPVVFSLANAGSTFAVPAGKRLVIEYVSGTCLTFPNGSASITATTNGTRLSHQFTSHVINPLPTGTPQVAYATFGDLVKIYADPGTTVSLDGGTDVCLNLTLSGKLVTP